MKMPAMKMPDMNLNKTWTSFPPKYKVFIIVATLFFLLSPGIIVNIGKPYDLVKIITKGGNSPAVLPLKIKSLQKIIWNYLTFKFTSDNKNHTRKLREDIRPVLVHSIIAGAIASYLLKA